MKKEDLVSVINSFVWGQYDPVSEAAEEALSEMGIDVAYIEKAIDFTVSELAQFFTEGEDDAEE